MMRISSLILLSTFAALHAVARDGSDLKAAAPTDPAVFVHRVDYAVRLAEDGARIEARFDVELTERGTASIQLLTGDVAVESADLPSGLRLERADNGYRLTLARARRVRFPLTFTVRATRDDLWRETRFTGPANAAITAVDARIAGADMEMRLAGGIVESAGSAKGESFLRGFLGASPTLRLRWRGKADETDRQTLLACETVALVQITPAVIKCQTDLTYEIVQGAVQRLEIDVPAGHALTRLEGDAIRDWQLVPTDGAHARLSVDFIAPQEKRSRLSLFTEQALGALPALVSWHVPQPLGIERENGRLHLTSEDVVVEPEPTVALRQIAAPSSMLAAYRFHARPASLSLRLRRVDPVLRVADRVALHVGETRVTATHTLNLSVEKAGVYSVELSPLGSWRVANVRGAFVKDWQAEDGRLRVNFARRLLGDATLEVQTEQLQTAMVRRVDLAALRVAEAEHETARIGVAAAPGVRVRTTELTGLREIPVASRTMFGDERLGFSAEKPDWSLALSVESMTPRVLADIFNLVAVGDGVAGGSAAVRYAIINQGVQELRLQTPPDWKNIDFIGANIRRKTMTNNVWTLSLQEKAWGGYTLVVTYDMAFDPQGALLKLGGLHALDVERETGAIAVSAAPSLKLSEQTVTARSPAQLFRIDEADLAAGDRALITRPVLLAYRYSGQDYDLTVETARFAQAPVLQAVADLAQLATVLTPDGQMLTQASFMLKNQEKSFQRFRLPEGAAFWSCHAGDEAVKPTADGDDILVPLPRGTDRDQAYPVEIVYAEKTGGLDTALIRRLRLTAPSTDVQTTFARWELYVPATHVLTRFGGSMTVAQGTRYGLRDAWNQFYRFYDRLYVAMRGAAVALLVVAGFIALLVMAARRRWRGLLTLLGVGFVFAILAGMLLPAVGSARQRARRTSAMSMLSQLGKGLIMYSMDRDGQLPVSVDELRDIGLISERMMIDPISGQPFVYVAGGRRADALPANAIVAYSPASGGGRNVLFNDGSVQWMNEAEFVATLAQGTQTPTQEPSPASAPVPPEKAAETLLRKLDAITIPEVDFRQANVRDIVQFLSAASREFDESPDKGVNIILNLGPEFRSQEPLAPPDPFGSDPFAADTPDTAAAPEGVPLVTFSARFISLREALKIVTQIAGLKYRIEGNVIMVVPLDAPDGEIVQRAYDVPSGTFTEVGHMSREELSLGRQTDAFGEMELDDGRAASMDMREVFRQMGVQWPIGSRIRYVPSLGKLMVANTADNLALMDDAMDRMLPSARPSAPPAAPSMVAPMVAGIRSLRIDVPRSGTRYEFAKVLDVRGEPLTVRATAIRATTLSVLQGGGLLAAFLFGLVLAWIGTHAERNGALKLALGLFMVGGSVAGLLLVARLLGFALIAAPPLALTALLVEVWRRRRRPRVLPPPLPSSGSGGTCPPSSAAGTLVLLAAVGALLTGPGVARADEARMAVRSVRIEGEVRDDVAVLAARFDIEAENVNRSTGARMALLGQEAAVSSFRSSSRRLALVRDDRRLDAYATRDVRARVDANFLVRVGGDVTRRTLVFAAPSALSTRLTLMLPEPDAQIEVPGAVTVRSATTGDRTRIEALFGPVDRIEVIWSPRMKRAAETATTVFCGNRSTVAVSGGVVNTRAELDYQVTQGEATEARIAIPTGERVLRVSGEGLRTWSLREEAGTNVVVAVWTQGVVARARIVVETERPLAPLPTDVDIRIPRALDVQRETGWIALVLGEEKTFALRLAEGIQKAEADEFLKEGAGPADAPRPAAAFRFFKSDIRLTLRIERVEPDIEAVVVNHLLLGYDQLVLDSRVDFMIKRAGVFVLRLRLPDHYSVTSVTGPKVARWDERTGENGRALMVRLKERTLGACALTVRLYRWLPEPPTSVDVAGVEPLDADTLKGFVKVGAELGLQANVAAFEGLTETPADSVRNVAPGGGALAYTFVRERGETPTPWTLRLTPEPIEPWVRAETMNLLRLNAGELGLAQGRAVVRFDVQNAPVKAFTLRVPETFRNVDIVGPNIRRRDETGGVWRVDMQSRVAGAVEFTVTWDQDYDPDKLLGVKGVETPGVERETGAVAILAAPPLQVVNAEAGGDLIRMDARDVPAWAGWGEREEGAIAWRYVQTGWTLSARVRRYRDAEALSALIDSARLVTALAEDGQALTEMTLAVRHSGRQYLDVALPEGSQLWTAFVDGQAVRPSLRNGRLLFPLEGRSGRVSRIVAVYSGESAFPARRGTVTLASPSFDAPVKDAVWDLYLPPGYDYSRFGGSMTHAPEAAGERRALAFSMGEYLQSEGVKKAARVAQMDAKIDAAEQKLQRWDLQDVNVMYQEIRQSEPTADKSRQMRMRKLEGNLKKAQASNVLESQRSFLALNLAIEGGARDAPEQQAQASPLRKEDIQVAAMQYERLQKAQVLALTQVRPLHVALPRRGLRYGFVQALQTETGRPMTVRLHAANARGVSPFFALVGGATGFLFLWAACAVVLRKTKKAQKPQKPVGHHM